MSLGDTGTYLGPAAFAALADALLGTDASVDRTSLYLRAEDSDFLRFNHAALRQATHVQQAYLTLTVERGKRRAESTLALSGEPGADAERLRQERALLIGQLDLIADDPFLPAPPPAARSQRDDRGSLPAAEEVIALVHGRAGLQLKQDLVGFYAAGPVAHAFADSLGSHHWHRVETFHFEWCLYHRGDKAVKTIYAGTHWDAAEFAARLDEAAARVPLLERSARKLEPGRYRAVFSPAAMGELLGTLGWSGFGLKSRRTGTSSLMRLERGEAALADGFHLDENFAQGTAPAFTAQGDLRPPRIALIDGGRLPASGGTLNSPRSAAEYKVAANGVESHEVPEALRLQGGALAEGELLRALDTGLYVSNLWYLNYSDRAACRITGMTRYACFWVEGGELVAPLEVMRFDDDAFRLFGPGLLGLSDTPVFTPHSDTYGARQLGSVTTPAALVEGFALTL